MSNPVVITFKDTSFAIVTGYGSTSPITGITNANPAVVSQTGHGKADNDVVKLDSVGGMTEVNGENFVIEVIDADSYRLLNCDATNYNAYTSGGTAAKATFSTTCQVSQYGGPTGTTPITTVDSSCGSTKVLGTPQHGAAQISFAVARQAYIDKLIDANASGEKVVHRYTLPRNMGHRFDIGYVTVVDPGSAQVNGNWTGSATIERTERFIDVEA